MRCSDFCWNPLASSGRAEEDCMVAVIYGHSHSDSRFKVWAQTCLEVKVKASLDHNVSHNFGSVPGYRRKSCAPSIKSCSPWPFPSFFTVNSWQVVPPHCTAAMWGPASIPCWTSEVPESTGSQPPSAPLGPLFEATILLNQGPTGGSDAQNDGEEFVRRMAAVCKLACTLGLCDTIWMYIAGWAIRCPKEDI